jgi:hypothetical protein
MKPLNENDKPKLYVLVALTVCVLGYGAFSFSAGGGTTTAAEAASPTPTASASPSGTTGTGTVASAPGATANGATADPSQAEAINVAAMIEKMGPPTGGRDPFQPVGPAATANNPAPPPVSTTPTITAVPTPVPQRPAPRLEALLGMSNMRPQRPGMEALAEPSVTVGATITPAPTVPVVVAPPPPPDVVVTGVVLGGDTDDKGGVAILRAKASGKDERRFVSVGDYVGNGFSVASVHAGGVHLKNKAGDRVVELKIGK